MYYVNSGIFKYNQLKYNIPIDSYITTITNGSIYFWTYHWSEVLNICKNLSFSVSLNTKFVLKKIICNCLKLKY